MAISYTVNYELFLSFIFVYYIIIGALRIMLSMAHVERPAPSTHFNHNDFIAGFIAIVVVIVCILW